MLIKYKVGLCFLLLVITIIKIRGQATGDPKQDFLYGEYYINQAKYRDALPFYLSVLNKFPDNSNVNYRIGQCYMHILGEQVKALPYLQKAVNNINPKYMEGKYKETGAPPEAWVLLGDAYHRDNQLRNASFAYYQYKSLIGDSDKDRLEMINKKIEGLGISYEYQRSEHTYKLFNMGNVINTRFSDYNPVMSADQKTLIYTQYWESYDKVVISHKINGKWTPPVTLNDQIGSAGDCYTSSLSADGKRLFLVRYGAIGYDIYESQNVDGEWQKMKPLSGKVNTRHRETSACISADGKTLYFSSDRPGGYGGFDLYKATLNKDSSWEDITNLGKTINTKGDEEAPFLTADGKTLYFSSNGHASVGNMDILYSELGDDGKWQEPVNFGLPVNTTGDDVFFIFFEDTHRGYLSRDLPSGYGKNDIYELRTSNDSIIPNKSLTAPGSKQNNNSEAIESDYVPPTRDSVAFSIKDTTSGIVKTNPGTKGEKNGNAPVAGPGNKKSGVTSDSLSEKPDSSSKKSSDNKNINTANVSTPEGTGEIAALAASGTVPVTSVPSEAKYKNSGVGDSGTNAGTEKYEASSDSIRTLNENGEKSQDNTKNMFKSLQTGQTSNSGDSSLSGSADIEISPDSLQSAGNTDLSSSADTIEQTASLQVSKNQIQQNAKTQNSSVSVTPKKANTRRLKKKSKRKTANQPAEKKQVTGENREEATLMQTHADTKIPVNEENEAKSVHNDNSDQSEPADSENIEGVNQNRQQTTGEKETNMNRSSLTAENDNELGKEHGNFAIKETSVTGTISDELPVYTIQIIALLHPVKETYFNLSPLKISAGNDGFYRYTYGEFHGYSVAASHLDNVKQAGFPTAFVRDITTIQNYNSGLTRHEK